MLAQIVLTLSFTAFILWYIRRFFNHLAFLRRFPNPSLFFLPGLGHAYLGVGVKPEKALQFAVKLCRDDDPEMRKGAAILGEWPVLVCFHPETVEPILSSSTNIAKSFEYELVKPWLSTGLLLASGNKWRGRRKMLTPAFHFKILEDALHVFNGNGDKLADAFQRQGGNGETAIDILPFVTNFTLDVILEAAMGKRLDIQEGKASCEYPEAIHGLLHFFQVRQRSPWLYPEPLFMLSPMYWKQRKFLKVVHDFTKGVIKERKAEFQYEKEAKKRVAFLDLLLNLQASSNGQFSDEDVQEEVDTFMFAGHDTNASAMSWTLLLLACHSEAQKRVLDEQRGIFGDDDAGDVEHAQLSRMRYLEACIKEALRLFPSVPVMGRQLLDDLEVDGETAPKGATAIVFTYLLHRNETVWGKNAGEFVPERFLEGSVESAEAPRHPYAFVPFSAGPRNCIGQKFAMMEQKTGISKVIRRLKLEKITAFEDVEPIVEIVTRPDRPIKALFKPRR